MSLEKIVDRATYNYTKNTNKVLDPAAIDTFFGIFKQLIAAFQACKQEPQDVQKLSASPGRRDVRRLKVRVRREMGWRDYRRDGDEVVSALLQTGKEVTVGEVADAYDED